MMRRFELLVFCLGITCATLQACDWVREELRAEERKEVQKQFMLAIAPLYAELDAAEAEVKRLQDRVDSTRRRYLQASVSSYSAQAQAGYDKIVRKGDAGSSEQLILAKKELGSPSSRSNAEARARGTDNEARGWNDALSTATQDLAKAVTHRDRAQRQVTEACSQSQVLPYDICMRKK